MKKKTLVLRFDIDTCRCLSEGVPNLLKLARDEEVKFTFFCNMGRSISRLALLRTLLLGRRRGNATATVPKLSATKKLGCSQLIQTLVINPRVGASYPEHLRQALNQAHDVGLHGGSNHGAWQHGFRYWNTERIQKEVTEGQIAFEQLLGQTPKLFSSPGWQGSDRLNAILASRGFHGSADRHGHDENGVECQDGFCTVPTNLVAEPGGVAYFESFAARGLDNDRIAAEFENTLADNRQLYVLYDHPCHAGVAALQTVRTVIRCAKDKGVEITTMSTLVERALHQP